MSDGSPLCLSDTAYLAVFVWLFTRLFVQLLLQLFLQLFPWLFIWLFLPLFLQLFFPAVVCLVCLVFHLVVPLFVPPVVHQVHCCMKYPQILREKTSSEKYTVISLRIQWKLSAEGNAFRKCQQIILPLIIINAIIFKGQN